MVAPERHSSFAMVAQEMMIGEKEVEHRALISSLVQQRRFGHKDALHSAILDWQDGQRRHLAPLTPQAERPFETPYEG